MDNVDYQRISEVLNYANMSANKFANHIGLKTPQVFYDIKAGKCGVSKDLATKIKDKYLNMSLTWLLTGEGSMLNPQPQTVNGHYVTGSHNNVAGQNLIIGDSAGQAQNNAANNGTTSALVKVPVVPPLIKDLPNIDILEYLKNKRDNITYAPIVVYDVQLVMWFTVDDNALLPLFRRGDMVGLIEEPHDAITGKVYVIDTYPYGMLFRRVVADATSDNLLLRSLNKDDYPDISIKKSDIIRLYKIMCMVRLNNDI